MSVVRSISCAFIGLLHAIFDVPLAVLVTFASFCTGWVWQRKNQRPGLESAAALTSVPVKDKKEKASAATSKMAPDAMNLPIKSPKFVSVDPNKQDQGGEKMRAMASMASLALTDDDLSSSPDTNDEIDESECERLYGPYPSSIPVPFIDKHKKTPPDAALASAETMWDLTKYPDHRDRGTPDEWIPRDGRLVRLTGRHPFNVEPPLSVLNKHRFITPSSLHYVRNHGACPDLKWAEHKLKIGGSTSLVPNPYDIGMDELVAMEPREFPCTLVCAGNRRKEQNMIRQTIGFNWGPSGVSTNVWKGVLLRDLLRKAGVSEKNMAGKHVEFLGVEDLPNKVGPGPFKDEPWGKLVKYGTSVPLARAMNPAFDIIVAYQANGEVLQPDHGYPVRLIIPGYIGGRMVKWLERINVIPHETNNHYHYHDNRILPPHITAEEGLKGDWWYKPEYIFNELNINSAISKPDHNETLSIANNIRSTYEVAGYAYTGGGRKITRVEVTTDSGATWRLAALEQKEMPTDYGMHWCWIWWKIDLKVADLIGCKEVWCRAWDESNNPQPLEPTWNLMGMGNNQVFRVKVHMDRTASGEHVFRFEHPTQAGQQQGGWMTTAAGKPDSAGYGRLLEVQGEAEVAAPAPAADPKKAEAKIFTMAEVNKHNEEADVWIVVNDRVYDCTEYLELHPGGIDSIIINAGEDATEDFVAIHSLKATKMLERYYIGNLDVKSKAAASAAVPEETIDEKGNKLALNPRHKTPFDLQSKTVLSHDTYLLDFALPTKEHVLGLPTGKHMFLSAKIDGETVMRRYTPISSNYDVGCVKFVIKAYRPTERFPRGGKMSQYLDSIKIGDAVDMRGPVGEFEYTSNGNFFIDGEARYATRFNMVAGGTGITPVMQVAAEILRHPEDTTQMSLIFACREENDLLMRSTLDEWAEKFPDKFRVEYILSDGWPKDWKYSTGFVSKPLFAKQFYAPGDDVYSLMCGPPVMLDKGCTPNLVALGHKKDKIFAF
uniref:Nitrate reductase n=1 Tax=Odontella aurita TaxID=265563 RepID=A0A7S4NA60_9STRA|mmetsp:Transcript_55286/g.165695  ORF Transcript_55286/g.165695 Transcript_55286/m.165695 type:complete len:999 (+) Transcript_55286:353-3349(+)